MIGKDRSVSKRSLRFRARLVRRAGRRLLAMLRWRRLSLQGLPVLFANSFPKSGTHLLTQILAGFPAIGPAADSGLPAVVMYEGYSGRARSSAEILADLQRLLPGDIGYGHLHALPGISSRLAGPGFCTFFILRDPRDVVVSHVHYVTEMEPKHAHHLYYTEALHSFDERLRTSILGLAGDAVPFPDISARFAPFLSWLGQPGVLTLRYEDFITEQAGAIGRVLDHAVQRGFPLALARPKAMRILAEAINPQRSPTFRSGLIGGWRKSFSEENKTVFKDVAGDLLIRLGYEQDNDW